VLTGGLVLAEDAARLVAKVRQNFGCSAFAEPSPSRLRIAELRDRAVWWMRAGRRDCGLY
jgi:hypothetical protein